MRCPRSQELVQGVQGGPQLEIDLASDAGLGPVAPGDGGILLADVAGEQLVVSGWVAGNGSSPSDVKFIFDNVTLVDINPVSNQPWTHYSFDVTATGHDAFTISFMNGFISNSGFDALDSFSVASAVPEPSTWAMMILGFLGVGFMTYRKKTTLRLV